MRYSLAFGSVAALLAGVSAHTWVEQAMNVAEDGSYFGAPGYIRGYVPRNSPNFGDAKMSWLSPQNGQGGSRVRIDDSDILCHPSQRSENTNKDFPNLQTAPGNVVALRYLENGHVTLPNNQLGKTPGSGKVYIYGTTNPKPDEKLTNVLQWTPDGSLDNGRLLNVNAYDDGRCYQINPAAELSVQRQAEFPNPIDGQPGVNHETWCQNVVKVPEDATGQMTVYWVWQWPTQANVDPGLPNGKDEIYTSCMDFGITSGDQASLKSMAVGIKALAGQDPAPALPDFMQRLQIGELPTNPVFYNPGATFGPGSGSPSQPAATPSPAQGQPGQFAPNQPSTLQTSASPAVTGSPTSSQEGVVYFTMTSTEFATTTVYADEQAGATGTPGNQSDGQIGGDDDREHRGGRHGRGTRPTGAKFR